LLVEAPGYGANNERGKREDIPVGLNVDKKSGVGIKEEGFLVWTWRISKPHKKRCRETLLSFPALFLSSGGK
jgi:hypothetical protein